MPDRHLVAPFRIQQIGPVLRRVLGLQQLGVVGNQHRAGGGWVIETIGVEPLEFRADLGCGLRHIARQRALGFQCEVMADIGRAEHVALRDAVFQIVQQPFIGNLRGGANDSNLDAGIAGGEAAPHRLRRLAVGMGGVPGNRTFAAGSRQQRIGLCAHRACPAKE